MTDASGRTRRIDDAGEKIGGARKDWRQRMLGVDDLEGMTNDEAVEHVRKDNVWPQPDWKASIEGGMPTDVAAHAKIIRDRMAQNPAPRRSTDDPADVRRNFVAMTTRVRDMVMSARSMEDIRTVERRLVAESGGSAEIRANRAVSDVYFSVFKARTSPFTVTHSDARKVRGMLEEGFPEKVPAWRKGIKLYPAHDNGVVAIKDGRQLGDVFANQEAAWAWLEESSKTAPKAKKGPTVPDRPHLDRVVREGLTDHRDGRDVSPDDFISTFGFRGVEFGNWLPDDERQRVLNMAYDALHDLGEVLGIPPSAISLEGTLAIAFGARGQGGATAHYESGRRVLNMTRLRGSGFVAHEWGHAYDHWAGEVDCEGASHDIRSGTGWRDHIQSWARKEALRNLTEDQSSAWVKAVDLLSAVPMSKADAVERLGDRIARLEKETETVIANRKRMLERPQGASSRKFVKEADSWLSNNELRLTALRKRFDEIESGAAITETRRSHYLNEARKLCGPSGEYWSRPNELFARAFECFVFDALESRGSRSDYLVHGVEEDRFAGPDFKGNPYPVGSERELFNEAITEIVETMRPRVVLNVDCASPSP